jgi:superfamily II DNA or RNA helicase
MYRHSPYQAAVAAIAASKEKSFVVVTLPTGSGKTWVQGLLARYYCDSAKRVAILEPTEALLLQTSERLGPVHIEISFYTLEHFYKHGCSEDVLILDEYDCMMLD